MRKIVAVALTLGSAFATQAEVISDIKVKGLKRMEPQTVMSYLPFKKGEDVSRQGQATALRELYKTGFFSDVKMDKKDGVLTITVEERPVISKISFEGNDKADEKVLKTEVQLKVRDVYTPTKLKADAERLTEIYRRMGMHSAV
ncbi:MAG: outer membrane protein assembly factor BamA, partial [Alphaproteobacteria bacterium]|nr:outer membrane protein assembly factor BamA [Alphaproteobacteria bacterium]